MLLLVGYYFSPLGYKQERQVCADLWAGQQVGKEALIPRPLPGKQTAQAKS